MKSRLSTAIAAGVTACALAACADQPYSSAQSTPAPYYPAQAAASTTAGYVERIEVVRKGDSRNIAGTLIGGIVGGLIGHQIGGGSGQTVATIAGAVGGGIAGSQIERRTRGPDETFRVTVRLDDGSRQTVTQDNITDLRTGDRVRIDGNQVFRY